MSVVIPVRNEADAIETAIRSALDQDYPGTLEVIVADGMSTDGTREAVERFAAERVRLVDNPATTTPAALNRAIDASGGDVVVRCDAHSVLPPGYVRRAVELLESTGAVNVGGIQRAEGEGWVGRAIALAMSSPIGVGDARFHYGGEAGPTDTVYLGVFRRAALLDVGGFDETLIRNQDYELNVRLRKAEGVVYFHPDLQVVYRPRRSFSALARQYYQYGSWKRVVLRRHPASWRWRQLAPPALVVSVVASAVMWGSGARTLGAVVPVAYASALVGAAVIEGVRHREPAAVLLPAAATTMHLSWGTGFLVGGTPGQPSES